MLPALPDRWRLSDESRRALASHGLPPAREDGLLGVVGAFQDSAEPVPGPDGTAVYVDTDDWERPGVKTLERRLLAQVRPGRTVLMHDGGGDRQQTLTALRHVLPVLVARGYDFEPVPGC